MKKLLLALLGAPLMVSSLSASTFDFAGAAASGTVYSLLVNPYASGEITTEPDTHDNQYYYVGNTMGQIGVAGENLGNFAGIADAFQMYCVDFLGQIDVPTVYSVTVETLGSAAGAGNVMGVSLDTLEQMAYLGSEFGTGDAAKDAALQQDIWNLSVPGSYNPLPFASSAGDQMSVLLSDAQANYGTGDYSGVYLLNITASGQDFMTIVPGTPVHHNSTAVTPEPGTFLLGAGAGVAALLARRRKASRS